jgi:hypothetical protein
MLTSVVDLDGVARAAIEIGDVQSAAVFVVGPLPALELGAAAGISGPPLDGLVAAVRNPDHPVARTLHDDGPTFDVPPMAPGGPALRSHLPLVRSADGDQRAVGVLAVAHDRSLDASERRALVALAERAAGLIGGSDPARTARA